MTSSDDTQRRMPRTPLRLTWGSLHFGSTLYTTLEKDKILSSCTGRTVIHIKKVRPQRGLPGPTELDLALAFTPLALWAVGSTSLFWPAVVETRDFGCLDSHSKMPL